MPILADKIEIYIDDKKIENYQYSNIKLVQELQKPNELTFHLHKDDVLQDENSIRYSLTEKLLGKKVELRIRTVRENKKKEFENDSLTFIGVVFNVNILKKNSGAGPVIEVTAYSPDYFLFDHPHCYSYSEKTLKEIVEKTIEPYKIESCINPFIDIIPYVVQYNETSYNFLRRLSSRFAHWFYYDGEKLKFAGPDQSDPEILTLGYDVNDYHYRLHLKHLNFSYADHDYLRYINNKSKPYNDLDDKVQHNLTDFAYNCSKDLYKKETFLHDEDSINELYDIPTSFEGLTYVSDHALNQGVGEKMQMLTCYGSSNRADLRIGVRFIIEEEYEKEKGGNSDCEHDALIVCKIIHTSDGISNYENQFVAMPRRLILPPYIRTFNHPKAPSQRAVVMDNNDPDRLGRVRIQFLWQKEQDEEMMTPWIRMVQPHAGNGRGFYFIPEIGDEVMVGFENENAEKPYVIGTLYHGNHSPELKDRMKISDSNDLKYIRTRNGHTISIFDFENEGGGILLFDKDKDNWTYQLRLDTDEKSIRLKSRGDIVLSADNDIIIKAGGNIVLDSGADIKQNAGKNRISEIANKDEVTSIEHFYYANETFFAEGKSRAILCSTSNILVESEGNANVVGKTNLNLKSEVQISEEAPKVDIDGKGSVYIHGGAVNIKDSLIL
ncbi:MAG: phage baseplate assembly protein V [Bacteroidales bacterium]|jgi:uncharacterized protein involved in type VI secretion and phage assembly|nr:phage baseplate assembly protein V [Bacteroidales bacterium]